MSYKKEIKLVPVTEENAADSGRIIFASWGETYRGLIQLFPGYAHIQS